MDPEEEENLGPMYVHWTTLQFNELLVHKVFNKLWNNYELQALIFNDELQFVFTSSVSSTFIMIKLIKYNIICIIYLFTYASEPSYPSPAFTRNYSSIFLHKYELWNTYFQPTKLYPYTPWDPVSNKDLLNF